jgi:alkanesulfonate monooxygenase SsuD/methylene tetrahydromethanopterin reductase-like flavin-dependent oxidoreductase (luciferase family)
LVRLNIMIEGQDGVDWAEWVAIAYAAEAAGLEGLFRSDHYLSIRKSGPVGGLDAWATLAALAAVTTRIRLGTLVSPVTFRSAAVLARLATTVDLISGGRVDVGVGAGWYEAEHRLYDFSFPPLGERLAEFESQLEVLNRHWSDADKEIWPKPVQRPRPHVIVGGLAKPRTVRAAVRFADEYNTYFPTIDEARERRRLVDEAAAAAGSPRPTFSAMLSCVVGNDRAELDERLAAHRAVSATDDPAPISGTVEQVAEQLRFYRDAGVERLMVQHLVHEDTEMIGRLGEVASLLKEE